MLHGFLFAGRELMRFLMVLISLFIMSGLCLSQEKEYEQNKYEIYEVNLVTDIMKDVEKFVYRHKWKYGIDENGVLMNILETMLIMKYNMLPDDFIILILGDTVTLRPIKVAVGLDMVFEQYVFEYGNLNVEEKDEKIGN